MADQAKVASLDAVEAFRTSLIVFMEKATAALDDLSDSVRRTRHWVQDEQPNHWLMEKRKAQRKLEQAEQELYSSRLSTLQETSVEAQMMVRRGRQRMEEIEAKLRLVKRWGRDYDSEVEPLARRADTMRDLVMTKYPKAVAQLTEMLRILEEYAQIGTSAPPPSEAADNEPTE